jgi:hypothetical protein
LATLVACIVIVWLSVLEAGAVYIAEVPLCARVPTAGERDQFTPALMAPPVVKAIDCELVRLPDEGAIVSTGTRFIVEEALLEEFATLAAVIVITTGAENLAGAV